jgi:uncharacterized protein with NAD-binding domain and iron-sulfur cluster
MVGAYRETMALARQAGALDLLRPQDDLRLEWADERGPTVLACPRISAPLHLLAGLLALRIPWSARLQALRLGLAVKLGRRPDGLTLAEYFARTGQGATVRRLLWDPLALAIVNEVPERAAAVLFHRVYQEAFLGDRGASRLVFLRRGWGVLADRLAAAFESRGGVTHRRAMVEGLVMDGERAAGVRYTQRAEARADIRAGRPAAAAELRADAVVAAVPWHALPALLPEEWRAREPFASAAGLGSAPIVSVELWLDRVVLGPEMVGFRDTPLEWAFDKGRLFGRAGAPQHLSFIASAAFGTIDQPNAELVAMAEALLRRACPAMAGATVTRSLVLRERDATFASSPQKEALRPGPLTPLPGLYLAGDWTDTGLPATIEGAVRSGRRAALEAEKTPAPTPPRG